MRPIPVRVALAALCFLACLSAPASAAIVINEVESDGLADFIEITNTGPAPVDISGYRFKDDNNARTDAVDPGTTLGVGAFYVKYTSFGLGDADQARVFESDNATLVDSTSWATPASTTYARCPDGIGPLTGESTQATPGGANDCFLNNTPWPGSSSVAVADVAGTFPPGNMSGLAYQGSGTTAKGVMWAVRNNPGTLFRLVWNGTAWTKDTANGWTNGKAITYANGGGNPDGEGVTIGANGFVYVATERDGGGASRPTIERYDVTGAGASLTATQDFEITDAVQADANQGFEAIAYISDAELVAKGFVDETTNAAYDPASYPNHGGGLFFAGIEANGEIRAYALNHTTNGFTRVATIASGFPSVMDLQWDPETEKLWAACDNNCSGRTKTYAIGQNGRFALSATYERPTGMANLNNEGFLLAPRSECVAGSKPVYWLDDSNTGPNTLRAGTIACTPPPSPVVVTPPAITPPAVVPPVVPPAGPPSTPPVVAKDTTKPRVSGLSASRTRVSFRATEAGRATITVERRSGRRFVKVKSFTATVKSGTNRIAFRGKVSSRQLRSRNLRVKLVVTDRAGNRSAAATKAIG